MGRNRTYYKTEAVELIAEIRFTVGPAGIDHMSEEQSASVAEPIVKPRQRKREESANKPRKVPKYNVILWDDDHHTYEYVIRMMQELFACEPERGFQLAKEVDSTGRVICLTTTLEHAELKRDQIHAFGRDKLIAHCQGSMSATIEPVE